MNLSILGKKRRDYLALKQGGFYLKVGIQKDCIANGYTDVADVDSITRKISDEN
jgi:hypothetical protein